MNKVRDGEQTPISKGIRAENAVCEFLSRKSFAILDRNYRIRQGEIDIVAQDQSELVFIEVKYLSGKCLNYFPEEQVTRSKRKRLESAAKAWMNHHNFKSCRFDVVAVMDDKAGSFIFEHIINAWDE